MRVLDATCVQYTTHCETLHTGNGVIVYSAQYGDVRDLVWAVLVVKCGRSEALWSLRLQLLVLIVCFSSYWNKILWECKLTL
jgi:hypothetical protein